MPAVVEITSDKLKMRTGIELAPRYYRDIGPSSSRLSRERLWGEHTRVRREGGSRGLDEVGRGCLTRIFKEALKAAASRLESRFSFR